MNQESERFKSTNNQNSSSWPDADLCAECMGIPTIWVGERTIIELLYSPRDRMEVFAANLDLSTRGEVNPSIFNADIFGDVVLGAEQTLRLFNVIVRGHVFTNGGRVFIDGKDATEAIIENNLGHSYASLKYLESVGFIKSEQIVSLASNPNQYERVDRALELVQTKTVEYALEIGLQRGLVDTRSVVCIKNLRKLEDRYLAAQKILDELNSLQSFEEVESNASIENFSVGQVSSADDLYDEPPSLAPTEVADADPVTEKIECINSTIEWAIEMGVISLGDAMMLLAIDETIESKLERAARLVERINIKENTEEILARGRSAGVLSDQDIDEFRSTVIDPDKEPAQVKTIGEKIERHRKFQLRSKSAKRTLDKCLIRGVIGKDLFRAIRDESDLEIKYERIDALAPKLKALLGFDAMLTMALDLNAVDFVEAAKIKNRFRDHAESECENELKLRITRAQAVKRYLSFARELGVLDKLSERQILCLSDPSERFKEALTMRDKALNKAKKHCALVMKLGMERGLISEEQASAVLSIKDPMTRLVELKKTPKLAGLVSLLNAPN